jgi:hypothetical protein
VALDAALPLPALSLPPEFSLRRHHFVEEVGDGLREGEDDALNGEFLADGQSQGMGSCCELGQRPEVGVLVDDVGEFCDGPADQSCSLHLRR